MSQAGSLKGSGSGGSGIQTITGNSGGALSGSNINVVTANSTPVFAGSGTTETLDFGITNLLLGTSGASLSGAFRNASVGQNALGSLTSGDDNAAFGDKALQTATATIQSTAVGSAAMQGATGSDGVGIGFQALRFSTGAKNIGIGSQTLANASLSGTANIGIGDSSLAGVTTGSQNIALGSISGAAISGASSSNIAISNAGAVESNTIRIGTQGSGAGQQNRNFQAGITGVTAVGSPVAVSSTGQLNDLGFGTATQVLTSNGAGVSPTWQAASGGSSSILSVGMNVTQTLTQNALVDIIYDTSIIDTASGYNSGTGVYTVPATGNYEITVTGNLDSTAGFMNGDIFINKNSGTFLFHGSSTATVSDPTVTVMNASIVVPLVLGDTIKISVFSQTTGATNYVASGFGNGYYNTMSVVSL